MFTWVCPSCGHEWDLATKECPNCAGQTVPAAPASKTKSDLRFWAPIVVGTLAVLGALYGWSRYRATRPPSKAAPTIELQRPAEAPLPPRPIEISGIRMSYDAQNRPQVRAVVVNHGEDALEAGASIRVALRAASAAPASPPLARFTVKLPATLKPGDSRDVGAPLDALATLAAMPPWHQLRVAIE
jgi:hypothetical protein